jgi:hypothetical protein
MKKLICLVLAIIMLCALTACGNKAYGPGNYNFKHLHLVSGGEGTCYELKKWYDNDIGIEAETVDGEGIYASEGTYILFESKDTCKFCN